MDEQQIERYGDALFECMQRRTVMQPLTQSEPEITIGDAYQISRRMLSRRLAENGETLVGKKIGVTSDAVQSMLGVFEPDFGFLTDAMAYSGGNVPIGHLIQPRAEAEIALILGEDLIGPGVTAEQVAAATEFAVSCFEVVDSRIKDWQIKIQDTVADNASCGIYVLGDQRVPLAGLDLAKCRVEVHKNGELLSEGLGSAVQGSPLQSIAWLANTLGELGEGLKAGDVVLSGSLVPLEPIVPGDHMSMIIPELGPLDCHFVD